MKRLKVMHIIDNLRMGGAEKVVATIAELLDKKRFEVSVCYFSHGELADEMLKKNIAIHRIPLNKWLFPIFLFKLIKLMRQKKIDIVHTHLFTADVLGRIAARLAGVRTIFCTLHTSYLYKARRDFVSRSKLFLDSITGNWFCDRFIAVSEQIKEYHFKKQGIAPQKTCVLGNPLRIGEFSPTATFNPRIKKAELGLERDSQIVLNVANLTVVKGQRYLITAMKKVVTMRPRAVLLMAGDGPLKQELISAFNSIGLDRHVRILGRRNDIAELLAVSNVFVLSSLNEGVSIALLEAMAMGKPIVATRVGGNPEVILDGIQGILVPSRDSEALANAIIELLGNEDIAGRLAKAAKEAALERFDAKVIIAELQELYLKSVNKRQI